MNNHTPGPWKIVIDALSRADGTKRKWEVNERGTDVLVEVDGHGWHEVALDIDTPANARLIAAAPDLYACLRNLYERGLIGGTDTDVLDEVKDALFAADADFDPYKEEV